LLGVHFKAKSNDDPDKRLAEAQHTRLIADSLVAEYPDAALVILGDFNDFPGSPPIDALDDSDAGRFISAARQLPASDAWSVDGFSGSGVVLHDDLIVNPLLGGYYVNGSADIIHDDEISAGLADLSDHAPVAASYLIQPLL